MQWNLGHRRTPWRTKHWAVWSFIAGALATPLLGGALLLGALFCELRALPGDIPTIIINPYLEIYTPFGHSIQVADAWIIPVLALILALSGGTATCLVAALVRLGFKLWPQARKSAPPGPYF